MSSQPHRAYQSSIIDVPSIYWSLCSLGFSFLIAARVIEWRRNFDGACFSSNLAPSSMLQ
jgi:hypothetical protein